MLYPAQPSRRASILLMIMGIITITLVIAFGFLRSMQMSRGTSQVQRTDDLARLAAEMGMQHAIAVCTAEYSAINEVRDNSVVPPLSRYDSPSSLIFAPLSRRTALNAQYSIYTPQPYDLGPDQPFQALLQTPNALGVGGYAPTGNEYGKGVIGKPGHARFFEANRFQFTNAGPTYDPSSYDRYFATDSTDPTTGAPVTGAATADAAHTADPGAVGGVVQTSFPPTAPFVRGAAITRRHRSDNPLFLDADFKAVTQAPDARYRLRYAVDIKDMSAALWLNTDMPWMPDRLDLLPDDRPKQQCRTAYKEALYAVGKQFSIPTDGGTGEWSDPIENVFLGHGAYANSRFNNGQPIEWPGRESSPDVNTPMWYRSPAATGQYFHCVYGSPFMNWNDPAGTWIGSAITSYTDLAFTMQGTNGQSFAGEADQEQRGDIIARFCATPFGQPEGGATDHPWAINALMVTSRVLEGMVGAYMPPAIRGVKVDSESAEPWTQYPDGIGNVRYNWGTPQQWILPPLATESIPGVGIDLFTEAFFTKDTRLSGKKPFNYPTPPLRDYWSTPVLLPPPADPSTWRPNHVNPPDTRINEDRYPGKAFFSDPVIEPNSQALTVWRRPSAKPPQVEADPAHIAPFPPIKGVDHLGRHIIFYKPQHTTEAATVAGTKTKYLSAAFGVITNGVITNLNCDADFIPGQWCNPHINQGRDGAISVYKGTKYTVYSPQPPIEPAISQLVYPYPDRLTPAGLAFANAAPSARAGVTTPQGWQITRSSNTPTGVFPNSYYNRVSYAFWHAVFVTQVANLAWASHQDPRSQKFFNTTYGGQSTAGIIYTDYPDYTPSWKRKGLYNRRYVHNLDDPTTVGNSDDPKNQNDPLNPSGDEWNPAAADYATVAQIDRQFVANLGESFDYPGKKTPEQALAPALGGTVAGAVPPRYLRNGTDGTTYGGGRKGSIVQFYSYWNLVVARYSVSNNIRTLLTPIDTSLATNPTLTTDPDTNPNTSKYEHSKQDQIGTNAPPGNIWLLEEWKVGTEADYTPGSAVGPHPTVVARSRAKLMERVLNDWRLSFLGSSYPYSESFQPKDFDGDGTVFCSGYLGQTIPDADTGLTCYWGVVDANGNGPGKNDPVPAKRLTIYSVTGCLTMARSRNYKIHVRGDLYDNFLNKSVSEQYLEGTYLVDPDKNVSRGAGAATTGLEDSVLIQARPMHSYYKGWLNQAYP